MVELDSEAAVYVIGLFAVAGVGWGANLSVRSALRGPGWALGHLTALSRVLLVPVVVGALLAFLVRPVWVGLGVVYVSLVVWWMAGMVRRNLMRLRQDEGFEMPPLERRREIVLRARRWMYVAAVVLVGVGLVALGPATASGVVALALAAVLTATAWSIRPDAAA